MKKLLPILIGFIFAVAFLVHPAATLAAPAQQLSTAQTDSRWVIDPEVTFIGKNARRAGDFLNWTLQNYNWVCVKQVNGKVCDNSNNPISTYWSLIVVYIVVPMLFVVILATSIVIIVTRGKSLTVMRFIPRFVAVVLLIVFSYSLLQFFYQFTDLIQGFFLRSNTNNPCPPNCISDKDLLYVGWDYNNFVGLRLLGDKYAESAFISLLLTKLTALTYFVMVFLLLVRKIILWFFIIVSPIFPILLLYYPVRNTGKIWIGEFFRWLLYAPLFAIFLNGLVYLWRHQIPLVFTNPNIGKASAIEYPTAVNILLGGPRQVVSPTNSVNLVETFALYVVSLIMLWIVILLPWILLQIFLDYAQNFAPGDTAVMKTLVNMASSRGGGGGGAGAPQAPKGAAISLPFAKKFSIPIDLKPGPTGAAKEITAENATIKATFSQPAYIPNAEITNAQVQNIANVKVPTIRDIAKFDVALRSQDLSKQQDMTKLAQQLTKIANPVVVTNTVEKNTIREIREKLVQQGKRGNQTANSILNAANASSRSLSTVSNQKMKNILQQIANPQLASSTNKEKMSKLHEMLQKESTQNKNQLASSILSVHSATSDKELQKIKDQLVQSSQTKVGKEITSTVSQTSQTAWQVQDTIKQIANPDTVTKESDKERVTKLRSSLEKASKDGNQLASSILAVNEKTSLGEIEKLQEKIQEAQDKGEPVAAEVADLAKTTAIAKLPMVNRVQKVSKEDYQAVKDMWKQNYKNIEVPQGVAASRTEMIKDDIASIDETIALLSSQDQDKVEEGMNQVSNLLPFLLVGGFSQTEIIEYLKAKEDAAKEVTTTLAVEEEEKVAVNVKSHEAQAQQTMSATIESPSETTNTFDHNTTEEIIESPIASISKTTMMSSTNNSQSTSDHGIQGEAGKSSIASIGQSKMPVSPKANVSHEILKMANLKMPKMQDIARFETATLSKDPTKAAESKVLQSVLEKIANPGAIPDKAEHDQYEKIKENLIAEKEKGNLTAAVVLAAANRLQVVTPESTKDVLTQMANPSLAASEVDKKRYTQLHESLTKASQDGNVLATAILSTKSSTPLSEVEKLKEKIQEAKKKGEPIAASVLPDIAAPTMPDENPLQPAEKEDYDEVQNIWEEYYRTLPVPEEYGSDRIAWITADKKYIDETVTLLNAPETEKQQEGTKRIANIMPVLLLGGFSTQEAVKYLQVKMAAATTVLSELQKEEENKVAVSTTTEKKEEEKMLSAENTSTDSEEKKNEEEKS